MLKRFFDRYFVMFLVCALFSMFAVMVVKGSRERHDCDRLVAAMRSTTNTAELDRAKLVAHVAGCI